MTMTIDNNIASRINNEHRQVAEGLRSALQAARRCGALLLQAKAGVEHGQWLPWLESNFEGSRWTASSYMRIAARWGELEGNGEPVTHLKFREALKLLAEPRQEAEQEPIEGADDCSWAMFSDGWIAEFERSERLPEGYLRKLVDGPFCLGDFEEWPFDMERISRKLCRLAGVSVRASWAVPLQIRYSQEVPALRILSAVELVQTADAFEPYLSLGEPRGRWPGPDFFEPTGMTFKKAKLALNRIMLTACLCVGACIFEIDKRVDGEAHETPEEAHAMIMDRLDREIEELRCDDAAPVTI